MNTDEYELKVKTILDDEKPYGKLKSGPTQKYRKQLVSILDKFKDEKKLNDLQYKLICPTTQEEIDDRIEMFLKKQN